MCHSGLASYQVSRTRTAVAGPSGASVDQRLFNQPSRSVGDLRQSSTHDGRCNALAFRRNATHPVPHSRSFKGLLIALDVGDVLADCSGNAFKVIFRVGGQRSVL